MKAVILAAGEGSRMRPLTYTRPKVMLPIANKPIVEHLLIEATAAGIKEFIFIVGYRDEQVRNYFGDGAQWGVSIEYCMQRKQLGTADALKMAEGLVDGNFLMMNGDVIVKHEDISRLMHKKETTISIMEVADTRGLGIIELAKNRVVQIYEKTAQPPFNTANAGLYLFTPAIFEAIAQTPKSPRGEYEITTSLQLLMDAGHTILPHRINYWLDLTYPWNLLTANESLLKDVPAQNQGTVEPNAVIKDKVAIGPDSIIRSGSYIVGPVIIGRDCEIGPNCYIRPGTAIGDNCHLGSAVEVKNSIIMRGTKIPHQNYVGDSIIGEDCNLGAGTKIANLRLDNKNVTAGGIDTGRRKLGAIIGDRVEIGINSSINVGAMIGNNTHIGPGATASGIILPDSRIL